MAIITPDRGYIGDLFIKGPKPLKGTVPRDFRLQVSTWISFPQAPDYTTKPFRIFRSIVDTGGKFATGVNNTSETGGKICRRCR
jgi:hypothetical protein